jgi:hypothetical protein
VQIAYEETNDQKKKKKDKSHATRIEDLYSCHAETDTPLGMSSVEVAIVAKVSGGSASFAAGS